jgi:hypothetical protein
LPTCATAQTDPPKPPLTVGQCINLLNGLAQLDGQKDKPYKLASTAFARAMAITALRPFNEAADRARVALMADAAGGKKLEDLPMDVTGKLNAEYAKVLDGPCNVDIPKIPLSSLKLGDSDGENPIPSSVLSLIVPIIDPTK